MPLYKAHFTFINELTQGRKVKINMKITTRKASTLAIALAIPATSFAGASAAFAADDASTKEVTVDVNLGSDAAESDVTLLAGDEEVGTETADEDGKVSFSYDAEGAETLKVEVGGDTVTLTDAKCTGVKESTENSSEDTTEDTTGDNTSSGDTASGTDTDVTDNSGNTAGKTSTAPTASTPGSTSTAPTSSDSEKPSASDSEKPSDSESTDASASDSAKPSDSKKPSTSGSEKPSASASDSAKPSDEKPSGNTDGSATNVAEALKDIEKNTDKNVATNKEVHGDVKDAKKLSAELKKLEKAEGIDKSKVEKTVNGLNDVIKKQKDGKVTVPAELQAGATDLLKTAVGVLAPQYSGIANTAIDAASGLLGGSGDGGSIIDTAKGVLGLGGSDSGSDVAGGDVAGGDTAGTDVPAGDTTGVDDSAPAPAGDTTGVDDSAPAPSVDTGAAASTPDTAETDSTPDTEETPSTPSTEEVELNSSVDDMSFTVDLEEGVASVDCDVDTEAAETDDEDEATSETSTTPSETPTSAAPAAAPSVSTPGPKVNTGGEVEGTSFFAKVKALF